MPIHDFSKTRVIRMPQLTPTTHAVDVWFEQGMIWFDDPVAPDNICKCTVADFEERLFGLSEMVDKSEESCRHIPDARVVTCGKLAWSRFLNDAHDLIQESKRQLHVGLPMDVVSDQISSRLPTSVASGFGPSKLILPN